MNSEGNEKDEAFPIISRDLEELRRRWGGMLKTVLIDEINLRRRVAELGALIEREYAGKELVVVAVLTGTVTFLADLIREIGLPLRLDFIGVSSYGAGMAPGELVFTKELRLDVQGRDVLLVDDILDTGRTLFRVIQKIALLRPKSLKVCVLLEKKARREEIVTPDYVGFQVPDLFVVGYGLDFNEQYRNLPFIAVLNPPVKEQ